LASQSTLSMFYHSISQTARLQYFEWCCRCLPQVRTLCVRCAWLMHLSPLTAELQQDWGDLVCSGANVDRLADSDVTIRLEQASFILQIASATWESCRAVNLHAAAHCEGLVNVLIFHLRRLRRLCRVFDLKSRKRLVCAFVLTRIDYCNTVLANLPYCALLHCNEWHAAARFVADLGPRDHHVTSTLISLHWLLIRQRITYKLCTMMHHAFCVLRLGSTVYI